MSSELKVDAIKNTADAAVMTFNNDGVITKNKMVAFSCSLNANHTHSGGGVNKITGWTVRTSSGTGHRINSTRINGFDVSNSRFTAPVAGLYCMYYKPDYATALTTNHYVSFGVNGNQREFDVVEDMTFGVNASVMLACLLELQVNDYAEIYTRGGTGYTLNGTSSGHQYHTMWYGYLIG